MPIPFTCPKCGKQMNVPDQYAGQSGPCASCGAQITIPGFPGGFAMSPPPPKSSQSSTLVVVLAIVAIGGLLGMGCLAALLLPAVQSARTAARSAQSMNNLRMIGLAMHNYHDNYGEFPPAIVKDANGTPLYSGRVLLLPFLEQQPLYQQWKLDKAWNSPENAALASSVLPIFIDPNAKSVDQPSRCDYLFVSGKGTCFDPTFKGKMTFAQITDGTSNTIMIVEVKGSTTQWAEPKEIDITTQPISSDGNSPRGVAVLFADGSVRTIPRDANPLFFQKAATRAGGELLDPY